MMTSNILNILKKRYNQNTNRHVKYQWEEIERLLTEDILKIIEKMENTGGEPDCVVLDEGIFYIDMSSESPSGRRSLCYDKTSRVNRKKFPPTSSVEEMAEEIGIHTINEEMYLQLQNIEPLDQKTSSWIKTDNDVRSLGGAIFGDRRFNRTFFFHNSADSYYKDRGFRGYIKL